MRVTCASTARTCRRSATGCGRTARVERRRLGPAIDERDDASMSSGEDLDAADHDLDHDEHDDGDLEAQRTLRVDDVGQRIGGPGHRGELALECIEALLQFVLILEPRIE